MRYSAQHVGPMFLRMSRVPVRNVMPEDFTFELGKAHILRHGNATLMSSFGAPQNLRQQRLGHAAGSPVTESVYTHVISDDGKRVAAQLGSVVWPKLDASWTEKKNGSGLEHPKPLYLQ